MAKSIWRLKVTKNEWEDKLLIVSYSIVNFSIKYVNIFFGESGSEHRTGHFWDSQILNNVRQGQNIRHSILPYLT